MKPSDSPINSEDKIITKDVKLASFIYTESPGFHKIPTGPVRGIANNKIFEAKTIIFRHRFRKWSLEIWDTKISNLLSPLSPPDPAQHIKINLSEEPTLGKKMTKPMSMGHGWFQIQKIEEPAETISWNSENTWILDVTKWDIRPWDQNGDRYVQQLGGASGRLYVSYKGNEGSFGNSGVAGIFENAYIIFEQEDLDVNRASVTSESAGLFSLSVEDIEEAIHFGTTAEYKINDLRGYELGINKFPLNGDTGHVEIITPFLVISEMALEKRISGKKLMVEEAKGFNYMPTQVLVSLFVEKENAKEPITFYLKVGKESVEIKSEVMEYSQCDERTGKCLRTFTYMLPEEEVEGNESFEIIAKGKESGEKRVEVDVSQIK